MAKTTMTTLLLLILYLSISCSSQPTGSPFPSEGPSTDMTGGPSAAFPPTDECLNNLLNMSDCLSYVTQGSNLTAPDKPCCPELAGLVESNPICLCRLLGNSDTYGIKIDMARALKLPSLCSVSTPDVSLCSVVNGSPVGSPTSSAEGPGGQSPEAGAAPSSGNSTGGSTSIPSSVPAIVAGLAFAFLLPSFF